MAGVVEETLAALSSHSGHNLDHFALDMILQADHLARQTARDIGGSI
jgi:hypothetical protein